MAHPRSGCAAPPQGGTASGLAKPVPRRLLGGSSLAAVVLASSAALAQSAPTRPAALGQCSTCHGANGLSTLPNAPNLAGQPQIYLVEQMKAYRSGKRSNEVMNVVAKPLSDADIDALAVWYSSLKIEVRAP
jgi:cytochrome c553